jgi:hypothetical protein
MPLLFWVGRKKTQMLLSTTQRCYATWFDRPQTRHFLNDDAATQCNITIPFQDVLYQGVAPRPTALKLKFRGRDLSASSIVHAAHTPSPIPPLEILRVLG